MPQSLARTQHQQDKCILIDDNSNAGEVEQCSTMALTPLTPILETKAEQPTLHESLDALDCCYIASHDTSTIMPDTECGLLGVSESIIKEMNH
jgi:hypothetical protein